MISAQPVPAPYGTWEEWVGAFRMEFDELGALPDGLEWSEFGEELLLLEDLNGYNLPSPSAYGTWQEWAAALAAAIN